MNTLLVSSEKDEALTQFLQQKFEETGCSTTSFYPDLGSDATLPAHALRIMQSADYFIYLITRHSQNSGWISMLTPEKVAPLCAVGVHLICVVANGGNLPPELAYLPCLYFLDDEILSVLIEGMVNSLNLVNSIEVADLYHLRYGARDLEAFLETAQGVAMAYGGLEAAWDEMPSHDDIAVKALFQGYTSDVSFGVNFTSRLRLETYSDQNSGGNNPIFSILEKYKQLERDWHSIAINFEYTELVRANILAARCRAGIFIDLIYLIMALKLQPYCDQYLHMQGLKHKQEMSYPDGPALDAAVERLSFLMEAAKKK